VEAFRCLFMASKPGIALMSGRKYLLDVSEPFFEGVLVFHDPLLQALQGELAT
jgi:hypothetical protein